MGDTTLAMERRPISKPVTGFSRSPAWNPGPVSKQLIPPDITGQGSHESGSSASVLDHRFGQSDAYTLGVEEEYQLLDGTSFDLVQHIETVLAAIEGHELEPQINPELMQSVLEIATPVCHTPADVMRELTKLRSYVCGVAREKGMRVGSAGTHPFSLFERQRITAKDRYRQLVDQLQYIARRELIFGMHVHVAVDDPDKAIKVVNGLLPQLGPLLALSASSPFWRGEPTGLMSSRQMVFASFPRSGPPPRFRDYADYAEVVGQLERSGCIADYTHIWWDIRLHPRLGTIEIRICDAVTRVEDAVAITAYCQALVKLLSERHDAGEEIPSYHRILTTENKWLAARYGLEAPVMDLATGRRNRIPVSQLVRRTVREIEPHARELGCERELEGIATLLGRGNSADRQLRIFNANRDIREVVEEIAIATEALPAAAVP
jgi:carboxylate-amine ligase